MTASEIAQRPRARSQTKNRYRDRLTDTLTRKRSLGPSSVPHPCQNDRETPGINHAASARFLVSTMAVLPGPPTLRARDLSTRPGESSFSWVFVV
jgi:hypothetical protein